MSMSRKALKLVQKVLPQLRVCNDKLVLPPTEHILRAYKFERTPYKEQFYLWRLVLPLYRYHRRQTLEYSMRIPRGARVRLSRDVPDETAAGISRIIAEDISNLEIIRTPRDFLTHVSWMIGNDRPSFLLDLAVTYFLVERSDEALATLSQTVAETEKLLAHDSKKSRPDDALVERLTEIDRVACQLAGDIRSDPQRATETVREWERTNIAQLGLGESMVNAT